MSKLDEAMDMVAQVQGLIHADEVEIQDEEEIRTVAVAGGSGPKKKTGRRVMTITIPYTMNRRFLAAQIQKLMDFRLQCQSNEKSAELQMLELEEMLDEL